MVIPGSRAVQRVFEICGLTEVLFADHPDDRARRSSATTGTPGPAAVTGSPSVTGTNATRKRERIAPDRVPTSAAANVLPAARSICRRRRWWTRRHHGASSVADR